jgi:hypothetical protein
MNFVEDFESLKQLKSKLPEHHLNPVLQFKLEGRGLCEDLEEDPAADWSAITIFP